jgi:hypothetical protein
VEIFGMNRSIQNSLWNSDDARIKKSGKNGGKEDFAPEEIVPEEMSLRCRKAGRPAKRRKVESSCRIRSAVEATIRKRRIVNPQASGWH